MTVGTLWADERVYYPLHVMPYAPAGGCPLHEAGLPYVLTLRPHQGTWAPAEAAHTPIEAAQELGWRSRGGPAAGSR